MKEKPLKISTDVGIQLQTIQDGKDEKIEELF